MPSEELRVRSARVPLTVTAVGADGETDTLMRHCLAKGPAEKWQRSDLSYER